ncbi:uncharacterized protein EDB93DRAFT_1104852 [Suillus bovinus]|uniref:uncharacterized protein n=1 Tax=Suillus bovinus TaxID=48563 RepID=UPI001B86CF4F|nr:uncharacterized protein EDB93DRAFT_1104852 [Suillus bovinus]KAG2144634.1 hypothetical protein EDB93DRAFT_1104852 [Suillus bovinus]
MTDTRIYNAFLIPRTSSTISSWVNSDNALDICRDGFFAGGTNLLFESNHVVNGDDCLTVASGAKNITWSIDGYCEGSHGLSVGSLGEGGQVASVENNRTLNTARFKGWTGGNGAAIKLYNMKRYHIYRCDAPYFRDTKGGLHPSSSSVNETHIENFLFDHFVGELSSASGYVEDLCITDPCWYYVSGATGKEGIIFDLYPDTATNIVVKNFVAHTLSGAPVAAMCNSSTECAALE